MDGQPTGDGGKKTNMPLIIVVGVILLIASFLAGLTVGMKTGSSLGTIAQCDESALAQRLLDAGYLPPDMLLDEPVFSLSGTIGDVGSDRFSVTASLTPIDEPATYHVIVGSDTKLILLIRKDGEKFNEEMLAFERAMVALDPMTGTPPDLPSPYEEKEISITDLRSGMRVTVASGSDMRASREFTATEVRAEETVASPVAPPAEEPPVEEPPVAPPVEEPPVEEPPVAPPAEEPPVAPPVE